MLSSHEYDEHIVLYNGFYSKCGNMHIKKKHIVHIKKANAAHRNPLPLEVITKPLLSLHF